MPDSVFDQNVAPIVTILFNWSVVRAPCCEMIIIGSWKDSSYNLSTCIYVLICVCWGIKFWCMSELGVYCLCRNGSSHLDSLGFASLTVWNMKTWKAMVCTIATYVLMPSSFCEKKLVFYALNNLLGFMKTVLPLGKDPPAITSLSFNHNGKILAAAATDGMIHMFGILTYILGIGINCRKLGGKWFSEEQLFLTLLHCPSVIYFSKMVKSPSTRAFNCMVKPMSS